jgi:putative transcriptional regulator
MAKLNFLKEILDQKGIKQAWLAEKLMVSKVTVNNWCSNRSQPSLETLNQIAAIIGVQISELVQKR